MSFTSGKMAEQRVIALFNREGIPCVKSEIELLEYDLEFTFDSKKKTAEVKFDMMAQKTGNLAIEYWNSKKDSASGIMATKAHLWIVCLLDDVNITIWATTVKMLKRFLSETQPKKIISRGGDNNAELYIYSSDVILPIFDRLDNLHHGTLQAVIKKVLKKK